MKSPRPIHRHRSLAIVLSAVALFGYGCFERSLKPVAPCTTSRVGESLNPQNVDQVDLLLMIDNSGSMAEEQRSIIEEIPRIIRILTSGDRNGDGVRDDEDFDPVRSLHVGIITSDMGTGTVGNVDSCSAGFGDDGIMQRTGSSGIGCMASYPSALFAFEEGVDDPDEFATAVGCVAALGTGGCGFEQQLDAALKAVSLAPDASGLSPVLWTRPDYRPPTFAGGTWGHGGLGDLNDGFIRPNSALAIILVTDEEDCSTEHPEIFDRDSTAFPGDLNLRCHTYADQQYAVQRYIDGFIGLRTTPSLLIFGAITGVPLDAVGTPYGDILGHPDMQERIDPVLGNRLMPSCTAPAGRGVAYPPRRIVEVARGLDALGASTTVQSICNTSFTGAVDVVIGLLVDAITSACLPRDLNPDSEGNVPCDVFELLPPIGGTAEVQHCADLPDAEAYELEGEEVTTVGGVQVRRELCRVRQVGRAGAGTMAGWFYDDGDARLGAASMLPDGCGQRIAFSAASPVSGSIVRLECGQTILPGTNAAAQLGSFCDPATSEIAGSAGAIHCADGIATPGYLMSTLACDAFDRTCQIRCSSDADCTAAGLLSYVCDHRTADEVYGAARPEELTGSQAHEFCVNPTCTAE